MSFLFLRALSKAASALLGAMLSHASEKGGLSRSGEVGDRGCRSKGLQLKSLLWALTSIHRSLMPSWEFARGPYGPERGAVHSPLGLGPQFSSCFGASPPRWAAAALSLCAAREGQDAARDSGSSRPLSPLLLPSLSLSGLSYLSTLHAARDT